MYKTNIQESKELDERVSIRKENDVKCSDIESFEGGRLKYYYEHWKNTLVILSYLMSSKMGLTTLPILLQQFSSFKGINEYHQLWDSKLKSKNVIMNTD